MQRVCLEYLPAFQAWGVKKEVIAKLAAKGQVAEIVFPKLEEIEKAKAKYPELKDFNYNPKASAPTAGFLLGQDKADDGTEYYSISNAYARAQANTGTKIRFLDYENPAKQIVGCHEAVLPGGVFDSPSDFELDSSHRLLGRLGAAARNLILLPRHAGKRFSTDKLGKRYTAYRRVLDYVYKTGIPMLGICAGAQMAAAIYGGWFLYGNFKNRGRMTSKPTINHKRKGGRHMLYLKPGSCIYKVLKINANVKQLPTNTRHLTVLATEKEQEKFQKSGMAPPVFVPFEVVATTKDGVPEILINLKRAALLVQSHPEDYAKIGANGKPNVYQNVYNYPAEEAAKYKEREERRMAKQLARAKG